MISRENEFSDISDEALLTDGIYALDRALESIMEMKSSEGKALAHMVHFALVYGENALRELEIMQCCVKREQMPRRKYYESTE